MRIPFRKERLQKFCTNYIDTAHSLNCKLRRIGTVKEGIDLLDQDLADVSVITCRQELYGQFEKEFQKEGLCSEVLGYTTLHVVLPEKHPLASKETVDLEDYVTILVFRMKDCQIIMPRQRWKNY